MNIDEKASSHPIPLFERFTLSDVDRVLWERSCEVLRVLGLLSTESANAC
jgi:hypothetical protein